MPGTGADSTSGLLDILVQPPPRLDWRAMAKRRTSQIQRRPRASQEALTRRVGTRSGVDWRVFAIIGAVLVAIAIVAFALLSGVTRQSFVGTIQPDGGNQHVPVGQVPTYNSTPATSGPHWNDPSVPAPANWGVYTTASPLLEPAGVHNLEHGGIIIWYDPAKISAADITTLENFVRTQNATERYKVIVSPYTRTTFGHPIAVVAWRWLLYLDTANLDAIRGFSDAHYGKSPEPNGGPGPPTG